MLLDLAAHEVAMAVKAEIDGLPSVEAAVPLLEHLAGH